MSTAVLPYVEGPSPVDALHAVRQQHVSIIDVFDALPWFQRPNRESWKRWRTFLKAIYGLPMDEQEYDIFVACTGRRDPPKTEARYVYCIVGRRGGKTAIDATIMGYEACYRDYTPFLQPGERCFFPIVAADKKGARSAANYIQAFLKRAAFVGLVDAKELETPATLSTKIDFLHVPTTIEIFTASFRTSRGYTIPAFLGDEIAFWRTADDSANPDIEIIKAVRPGMATIPLAKLLLLSSPYAQAGVLWDAYDEKWGVDVPGYLVWKADTCFMNPSPQVAVEVNRAYEEDPIAADAEYGANFREDVTKYVSPEVVAACTDEGVFERLPYDPRDLRLRAWERPVYYAFVDTSGGSSDAFSIAIAHWDHAQQKSVQDFIRRWPAPFKPHEVTKEACDDIKRYGLAAVTGDAYAGKWPSEEFAENGVTYDVSDKTKHEIYKDTLPELNSRRVVLLDNKLQKKELLALDRRTTPLGKDIVDHPKGAHDDVINAGAGALDKARREGRWAHAGKQDEPAPQSTQEIVRREYAAMAREVAQTNQAPGQDAWETG